MTKELIALYKTLFFTLPSTTPILKTYAIVDSARDESVKEQIPFSGLNYVDLWHEELWENELSHPLYLVELEKENELFDYLLSQHKKSVVTYFISPYSLETLQAYYSMFNHVNLEISEDDFQKALFGFYDPNTLPSYISTLYNEEKIDEFFAGVAMWLSPNVDKEDVLYLAYRTKEGEVDDVNLLLSNLIEEENPSLNFDNVSLPTLANLEEYAHEVSIDQRQVQLFNDVRKVKFINTSFIKIKEDDYRLYHDETTNKKKAFTLFDDAKSMGLESDDSVYKYIVLGLLTHMPLNQMPIHEKLVESADEKTKLEVINQNIWQIIEQQRRETNG